MANVMTVTAAGAPVATNGAVGVQLSACVPDALTQADQSLLTLNSGGGDRIGGGRSYRDTRSTAPLSVGTEGGRLQVSVAGDETWYFNFQMPAGMDQIRPGVYPGPRRAPLHNPVFGGLA